MAEVDALSVTLTADASGLVSGMSAADVATKKALESTDGLSRAIEAMTSQMRAAQDAAAAQAAAAHEAAKAQEEYEQSHYLSIAAGEMLAQVSEKIVESLSEIAAHLVEAGSAYQTAAVQLQNSFGAGAVAAQEWAERTAEASGRSATSLQQVATSAKFMIDGFGLGTATAAQMSEGLAGLAVNLSKAKNIPLAEAMQKLEAGLHGAGRGLYEVGIALNKTSQDQMTLNLGLGDSYAKLGQAEQATVNYRIMMEGAGRAADMAANMNGTYAESMAKLKAHTEEAWEALGVKLLPVLTKVADGLSEVVDWIGKHAAAVERMVTNIGDALVGLELFTGRLDSKSEADKKATVAAEAHTAAIERQKKALEDQKVAAEAMEIAQDIYKVSTGGGERPRDMVFETAMRSQSARSLEMNAAIDAALEQLDAKRMKSAEDLAAATKKDQADNLAEAEKSIEKQKRAAEQYAAVLHHAVEVEASLRESLDAKAAANAAARAQQEIKAADQVFAKQREGAESARKGAEDALALAQKQYADATKNGDAGSLAAAKAALESSYSKVQAAAELVVSTDVSQISALKQRLAEQQAAATDANLAEGVAVRAANEANERLQLDTQHHVAAARLKDDEEAATRAKRYADDMEASHKAATAAVGETQAKMLQAQKDADVDHEKSWKAAGQAAIDAAKEAQRIHDAQIAMRDKVVGAMGGGNLVNVIKAGSEGASAGSVVPGAGTAVGAAVAAGLELLLQSRGVQHLAESVGKVLGTVSDALGSLVEPIMPVVDIVRNTLHPLLDALGQVLGAVGEVIGVRLLTSLTPVLQLAKPFADLLVSLMPLIDMVVQVVSVVIKLQMYFNPLYWEFLGLAYLVEEFSRGVNLLLGSTYKGKNILNTVFQAIDAIWNEMVEMVEEVLVTISHKLPDDLGGNVLRDLSVQLDTLKVSSADAATATQSATVAMGSAAAGASQLATNLHQAALAAHAQVAADQANMAALQAAVAMEKNAIKNGTAGAGGAAVLADLQKQLAAMPGTTKLDQDKAALADYLANAAATNTHIDPATLDQLKGQIAIDQANVSATDANTKATLALTASLTNMVSGFYEGAYERGALGGSSGGGGSSSSGIHLHGPVTIVANDPAAFASAMRGMTATNRRGPGRFG